MTLVKVDAKSFFSQERTFLHQLHIVLIILGFSAVILPSSLSLALLCITGFATTRLYHQHISRIRALENGGPLDPFKCRSGALTAGMGLIGVMLLSLFGAVWGHASIPFWGAR